MLQFQPSNCELTRNSDILAELDLRSSGIDRSEYDDLVDFPKGVTENNDQLLLLFDRPESKVMAYYSFQIGLRNILNTIQKELYPPCKYTSIVEARSNFPCTHSVQRKTVESQNCRSKSGTNLTACWLLGGVSCQSQCNGGTASRLRPTSMKHDFELNTMELCISYIDPSSTMHFTHNSLLSPAVQKSHRSYNLALPSTWLGMQIDNVDLWHHQGPL